MIELLPLGLSNQQIAQTLGCNRCVIARDISLLKRHPGATGRAELIEKLAAKVEGRAA
jgi:hypothetical protein